jgi:uncharacterized protein (TIGR02246 family)
MDWRKFVLLGCAVACVFANSAVRAQIRGHGNSVSRIGMRGAFTPPSSGRMPRNRAPRMNSALGLPRLNRFNYGDFDRHHGFRRSHRFNKIIFIGNFGFPWHPWLGWNWSYYASGPYQYSEYSYPSYHSYASDYSSYGYGYGNYSYGYGYSPLLYYGGYNSGSNYESDESVVRNILAEYTVSWNQHDTATVSRLFAENCEYIDLAGVHWKGVQEIVLRDAELFHNRLKTAVRRLTGAEVRFPRPDTALVHATWDVTGGGRTRESVPALKEITTMTMTKTNGKWLITDFQNTDSEDSPK